MAWVYLVLSRNDSVINTFWRICFCPYKQSTLAHKNNNKTKTIKQPRAYTQNKQPRACICRGKKSTHWHICTHIDPKFLANIQCIVSYKSNSRFNIHLVQWFFFVIFPEITLLCWLAQKICNALCRLVVVPSACLTKLPPCFSIQCWLREKAIFFTDGNVRCDFV